MSSTIFYFVFIILGISFVFLINNFDEANAAAYIKFDGIDGESLDSDHQNWSDLLSVSQAIHKPGEGTGATRRRGDVVLEDIVVVKELDKASPKLAEAVLNGKVYPKVEIHVTTSYPDAGRVTYYAYELKNVQISDYSVSGEGQHEEAPTEHFSLNFEEIKVTYTENDAAGKKKGNVEYSWKVEEGEAGSTSSSETTEERPPAPPTEVTTESGEEPTTQEMDIATEINKLPPGKITEIPREKIQQISPRVFEQLSPKAAANLTPQNIRDLPDNTKESLTPDQFKKLDPRAIAGMQPEVIEKLPALTKQIISPRIGEFPLRTPSDSTILQQGIPGQERYQFKLPKLFVAPYVQISAGISVEDVICNEGFELVLKASSGKPACLTPRAVEKLTAIGWVGE